MNKKMRLVIASLLAVGFFVGCTGDAGTSTPAVVTINATQAVDETAFDAGTGAITKETTIKAGDTGTKMVLSEGTVFKDASGKRVTKAPVAEVIVKKSETKATTTINFEVDGKKVTPTESVVISVPAPKGAKAGDRVQIEVPDDGSITKKLIIVIVKPDGTVDIRVFPKAFEKTIVIIVEIRKDTSTN